METLDISDEGPIRVITLNRPEALNALNGQMTDDLADAFLEAGEAASVKVVLMTGAGKAFWAGADLKEMGNKTHQPKYGF
ncbi:MAG: enoyl-CoA hydratase/isomerase family protein, partial [Akkermansiaceae bacterium]|nr:enoyl-CoA hydratase/isomerase family protein [Akkermansiaceae bacterium]